MYDDDEADPYRDPYADYYSDFSPLEDSPGPDWFLIALTPVLAFLIGLTVCGAINRWTL